MNLTRVDWASAQNLLVKLVQVLSPLTVHTVPPTFFLKRRFLPPSQQNEDFFSENFPATRVLSALKEVQKEVNEWVVPVKKEERPNNQPLERPLELKKPLPLNVLLQLQVSKKFPLSPKQPALTPSKQMPVPIVKQAKELITQVQKAISQLSNSKYIQKPKETPLTKALTELKPKLDRIIDLMGENFSQENKPVDLAPIHFEISAPEKQENIQKQMKIDAPILEPKNPEEQDFSLLPPKVKKGKEIKERGEESTDLRSSSNKKKEKEIIALHSVPQEKAEKKEIIFRKELPTVVLPNGPLAFEPKRLSPNQKKKKRKGFWFQDKSEDENP